MFGPTYLPRFSMRLAKKKRVVSTAANMPSNADQPCIVQGLTTSDESFA
jgi:hypothetical protein